VKTAVTDDPWERLQPRMLPLPVQKAVATKLAPTTGRLACGSGLSRECFRFPCKKQSRPGSLPQRGGSPVGAASAANASASRAKAVATKLAPTTRRLACGRGFSSECFRFPCRKQSRPSSLPQRGGWPVGAASAANASASRGKRQSRPRLLPHHAFDLAAFASVIATTPSRITPIATSSPVPNRSPASAAPSITAMAGLTYA
jgi:hypothetical protein